MPTRRTTRQMPNAASCVHCQWRSKNVNDVNAEEHFLAQHAKVLGYYVNYDKRKSRPYSCRVCDRTTSNYASMLKHLQKMHKIVEATEAQPTTALDKALQHTRLSCHRCNAYVPSLVRLCTHLRDCHKLDTVVERRHFDNEKAYEKWSNEFVAQHRALLGNGSKRLRSVENGMIWYCGGVVTRAADVSTIEDTVCEGVRWTRGNDKHLCTWHAVAMMTENAVDVTFCTMHTCGEDIHKEDFVSERLETCMNNDEGPPIKRTRNECRTSSHHSTSSSQSTPEPATTRRFRALMTEVRKLETRLDKSTLEAPRHLRQLNLLMQHANAMRAILTDMLDAASGSGNMATKAKVEKTTSTTIETCLPKKPLRAVKTIVRRQTNAKSKPVDTTTLSNENSTEGSPEPTQPMPISDSAETDNEPTTSLEEKEKSLERGIVLKSLIERIKRAAEVHAHKPLTAPQRMPLSAYNTSTLHRPYPRVLARPFGSSLHRNHHFTAPRQVSHLQSLPDNVYGRDINGRFARGPGLRSIRPPAPNRVVVHRSSLSSDATPRVVWGVVNSSGMHQIRPIQRLAAPPPPHVKRVVLPPRFQALKEQQKEEEKPKMVKIPEILPNVTTYFDRVKDNDLPIACPCGDAPTSQRLMRKHLRKCTDAIKLAFELRAQNPNPPPSPSSAESYVDNE